MTSTRPLYALAAALCLGMAGAVFAQAPGDGLPEGPGKEVLLRACTGCHDVSTVTGTPRTPQGWETVVGSMMNNGAELTGEEQAALQAYLVKNFGVKAEAAPAS